MQTLSGRSANLESDLPGNRGWPPCALPGRERVLRGMTALRPHFGLPLVRAQTLKAATYKGLSNTNGGEYPRHVTRRVLSQRPRNMTGTPGVQGSSHDVDKPHERRRGCERRSIGQTEN